MKILICLSNVPDTTTKIKFTGDNRQFDATGVQWIIRITSYNVCYTKLLRFKMTMEIGNVDRRIKPGMFGRMSIVFDKHENVRNNFV